METFTDHFIQLKQKKSEEHSKVVRYSTYVGKTTGDGRSTEAGSGTRCGRPGRRVPGASSGPGRPSCSPPWLRPGCTRRWALRAERTLSGSHIHVPPEARGHRETPLGGL